MTLAEKILSLRTERGMSQDDLYMTIPGIRYPSTVFAIVVGIVRGLPTLLLVVFTGRAWKGKRFPEKDG